jgi:hypothetical protein
VAHSQFLNPAGREYGNVSLLILYRIAVTAGVLILAF